MESRERLEVALTVEEAAAVRRAAAADDRTLQSWLARAVRAALAAATLGALLVGCGGVQRPLRHATPASDGAVWFVTEAPTGVFGTAPREVPIRCAERDDGAWVCVEVPDAVR